MKSKYFFTISQATLTMSPDHAPAGDSFFLVIGVSNLESIHSSDKQTQLSLNADESVNARELEVRWDEKFKFTLSVNFNQQLQNEYFSIQVYCGNYQKISHAEFVGDLEIDLFSLCIGPQNNMFELKHSDYRGILKIQVLSIQLSDVVFDPEFLDIRGVDCRDAFVEYGLTGESQRLNVSTDLELVPLEDQPLNYSVRGLTKFSESYTVCDFAQAEQMIYLRVKSKETLDLIAEFILPFVQTYRNRDEGQLAILMAGSQEDGTSIARLGIRIHNCPRHVQSLDGVRYDSFEKRIENGFRHAQGTYKAQDKSVTPFGLLEPACLPPSRSAMTVDNFTIDFTFKNFVFQTSRPMDQLQFVLYCYGFSSGAKSMIRQDATHFVFPEFVCHPLKTRHPYRLHRRFIVIEVFQDVHKSLGEMRFTIHNLLSGPEKWEGVMLTDEEGLNVRYNFSVDSECKRLVSADLLNLSVVEPDAPRASNPFHVKIEFEGSTQSFLYPGSAPSTLKISSTSPINSAIRITLSDPDDDSHDLASGTLRLSDLAPLKQFNPFALNLKGTRSVTVSGSLNCYTNLGSSKGLYLDYRSLPKTRTLLDGTVEVLDAPKPSLFELQPCYFEKLHWNASKKSFPSSSVPSAFVVRSTNIDKIDREVYFAVEESSLLLRSNPNAPPLQILDYKNMRAYGYRTVLLLEKDQQFLCCEGDEAVALGLQITTAAQLYQNNHLERSIGDEEDPNIDEIPVVHYSRPKDTVSIPTAFSRGVDLKKSVAAPINMERSFMGQSMMAGSYMDSSLQEIEESMNQSFADNDDTQRNTYQDTMAFYKDVQKHFNSYIKCGCHRCDYFISMNCKICFHELDTSIWILGTKICGNSDCGKENTYYYPKSRPAKFNCRKCKRKLDQSKSVTIECLRCDECGRFYQLQCPKCNGIPDDIFIYTKSECPQCHRMLLVPKDWDEDEVVNCDKCSQKIRRS